MALHEAFARWLRATGDRRAAASPLVAALDRAGNTAEAALLGRFAVEGTHTLTLRAGHERSPELGHLVDGRSVHVGPLPPPAAPGELWFDTVELSLMVLLPGDAIEDFAPDARHRARPHGNWLALRPVAGWQYAGFLAASDIIITAAGLFDVTRLLPDDDTSPVVSALALEVRAYRAWFGKRIVGRGDWLDVIRLFGPHVVELLWTKGAREWVGGIAQLDVDAAIEPTEINDDDREAFDAEEAASPAFEARRFFELYELPPHRVGFRTTVDPRIGALGRPLQQRGLALRDTVRR